MGKRVLLVDEAGMQSLVIDDDDFDKNEASLLGKSYKAAGYKILRHEDGTEYRGRAKATPAQAAAATGAASPVDEDEKD